MEWICKKKKKNWEVKTGETRFLIYERIKGNIFILFQVCVHGRIAQVY